MNDACDSSSELSEDADSGDEDSGVNKDRWAGSTGFIGISTSIWNFEATIRLFYLKIEFELQQRIVSGY